MKQAKIIFLFFMAGWVPGIFAQETVARIELFTQPESRRIRPFESMVVQLRAFAERTDTEGKEQSVRLKKNIENVRLLESSGGWLSKPFLFQGNEVLSSELKGFDRLASLLGTAETFVWQDSILYSAPEKPGNYHIEVTLEGKQAQAEIIVAADAPSARKSETVSFPSEPQNHDPYFPLAEHYAPFVAQETWFTPKADFITRFNFDGDWKGDDNWDDMEIGTSQAYVYYTALETQTHWFVIYNFYHPRDYSDRCVAGTCHENDNEGIILTIAKDGSRFGHVRVMETLAHNNIYDFVSGSGIRKGAHDIDGAIDFVDESHPVIFIESGGHGIFGSQSNHSRLKNKVEFTAGTGVTFRYKGVAERPRHPNDRDVGYALLPIYQEWWTKMREGDPTGRIMFDDFFAYTPYGNRPASSLPRIAGAFLGRKEASNKARPFWGWFDVQTQKKKILATGQWGLDPAYGVSQNLRFPDGETVSTDYLFNPYLIGEPQKGPETPATSASSRATVESGIRSTSAARRDDRTPQYSTSSLSTTEPSLPEIVFQRSPEYAEARSNGKLDLRLRVDGTVIVLVQGDHIRYEVKSGRPPVDDGTEMSQPLPLSSLKKLDFEKKDGRGSVQILSKPEASNNYTLRLQIDDPKGGDDRYHIQITWNR